MPARFTREVNARRRMEGRKSFLLRMDPELWRELERWAQEDLRSVNGQIEFVLRRAVKKRKAGEDSDQIGTGTESTM
jgi:hypothetical protein